MFPPDARTLSGEVASPQHLAELRLPASGLVLIRCARTESAEHWLLFCLQGCIACFHHGLGWHVESDHFAWVTPLEAITLRPATTRPTGVLLWRFNCLALPPALQPWLPAPARSPTHGPNLLTPSMQTLLLALRGCPVAPVLRDILGTGKLIELLTLILPPPADSSLVQATPRVLHPALRAVLDYMAAHLADPIGLPEMATAVHSSPSHLSRLFTAEFGHGPTVHFRRLRLDHAAALLRSGQANVTEAALAVGYQSLGQFSRAFAEHQGQPPSALIPRNNG
jgi:AraC-like DNA-binding protein